MAERFDCVVIGAGIGGLAAAARLVAAGLRPLVVEERDRVGGRFSSVDVEGFRVSTGAVAVECGGVLEDTLLAGLNHDLAHTSMMLTAVMIVGMLLAGKSALFVVFIALIGFFLYAMRSVLQAWAVESVPTSLAGAGVGIQFGITAIGAAIAPALFGMIADAYDLYAGFYFLAGIIAASNFLIFFIPNGAAVQAKPVTAS